MKLPSAPTDDVTLLPFTDTVIPAARAVERAGVDVPPATVPWMVAPLVALRELAGAGVLTDGAVREGDELDEHAVAAAPITKTESLESVLMVSIFVNLLKAWHVVENVSPCVRPDDRAAAAVVRLSGPCQELAKSLDALIT